LAWALGEPDLILNFDEPICFDDNVHDVYYFRDMTVTEDMLPPEEYRWMRSMEVQAMRRVVHHINGAGGIGGLIPGTAPKLYEDGYGQLLSGSGTLSMRFHYYKQPGPGTAFCDDQTRIGVRFMKKGEEIRYVSGGGPSFNQRDFVIPPGNPAYSYSMERVLDKDLYIVSMAPHGHIRASAALYELTRPGEPTEIILHVPKYDMNWQHRYTLREPILAPKGSKVRFTMWWDNSEGNPNNPDPTATVTHGQPTYQEMSQGLIGWRQVEERRIVVGEPLPDDLKEMFKRDEEGAEADNDPTQGLRRGRPVAAPATQ
jgi:hypothetical protein